MSMKIADYPNPRCCLGIGEENLCHNCRATYTGKRDRRRNYSGAATANASMTPITNKETLVINQSFWVQTRGLPKPLISPPLLDDIDSTPHGGAQTLNTSPKMLLPPNTMEVCINDRLAEIAAEKAARQAVTPTVVSKSSGPLIPPTLFGN